MDCVRNMNDAKLKPRLLRSLVRDRLPDEKRPLPTPSQLSSVLSIVRTHGLLTESVQGTADEKLIDEWKYAFDAWVERVLDLVSSSMPDKRWMGICLLGITCEECRPDRFAAAYSDWFQKFLETIQMPCDSHLIKVAACSSLSDLLTRLAGFTILRKDATSLVVKLVQPVLLMLHKDDIDSLWVGATDLLCTAIDLFPSAVHRHYDKVEASIVSKIMSGKNSTNLSKELTHCLALLPKARGDESSWFMMMQKILIAINMHLDDAFQGLKEGIKSSEVVRFLVPAGKDPPPPLGGYVVSKEEPVTKKLQDLLVPRVSPLMQCLCMMLTQSYPVQVTIPIHPLLAVVERVLRVDGSLPDSLLFATALQQELLCSELPALHLRSLDLLIAIIKGVRSQLLPHAANVVRQIREYFQRATLPCIRIKVYSIMQILLISMGAGMAQYLAQDVIDNAFIDLGSFGDGIGLFSSNKGISEVKNEVFCQGNHKKRKHNIGLTIEHQNAVEKPVVPVSVQLAALEALEALLTMGGSISSECWRSDVDLLLITVATKVCDAVNYGRSFTVMGEPTVTHADLQLAALHALLASLLSPGRVRPAHLSQGLELFCRGKRETGTTLAAFCAHALLSLEVLIHPRALPMIDFSVSNKSPNDGAYGTIFSNNQTSRITQFAWNNIGASTNLDVDDKDNDYWLENGEENRANVSNQNKHAKNVNEPFRVPTGNLLQEKSGGTIDHAADVGMVYDHGDENSSEPPKTDLQVCGDSINVPINDVMAVTPSEFVALASATQAFPPSNDLPPSKEDTVTTDASDIGRAVDVSRESLSAAYTRVKERLHYDSDSASLDSIPDIVNIEPDSD